MRFRILMLLVLAASLSLPATGAAYFPHVVTPGETLTSVAAVDGLTLSQLAAANGLSTESQLISGATLLIPPQTASYAPATASTPSSTTTTYTSTSPASTAGGYLVEPGDTLSAIALRSGTTVAALAAMNGLDPNGILYAGAAIRVPGMGSATTYVSTSTAAASASGQPVEAPAEGTPGAPPYPTAERVSSSEISQIAAANGVPASLAEAVGWQESGWNNALTSSAGAVGVMQVLPGTWDWINRTLTAGTPLAPASAASNVRGGVLLLHALLNSTGGNASLAAAGYYQGLSSVQQNGMYNDTQQYVNNVLALQHRFGGG